MYVEGIHDRRSVEAPENAFSHIWTTIRDDLNFDQEVSGRNTHAQSTDGPPEDSVH